MYLLNFTLMSFICEWAAQTCFTKSSERKILHYNRSVLVEHICLIGYSPFSLPRFPSPRKKCVLLKSWASRLALLSPVGREGAVSFLNFSSSLHLHIHAWHCGGSLLVLVYVSSYLAGYPRTAFKKHFFMSYRSKLPILAILETTAQLLRYQKESFLPKGKKRKAFIYLDKGTGDFRSTSSLPIKPTPKSTLHV